jgi:hypothetical protein
MKKVQAPMNKVEIACTANPFAVNINRQFTKKLGSSTGATAV